MTQALVSPHVSDPTLPESYPNCPYFQIVTNHVYRSSPFLTYGVVEVPLNTTTNDSPLPESTTELQQGTFSEDAPFELHIRYRVIIYSMVKLLKCVRDPYIRKHTFLLLRSNLCLTVEFPTATAYLQQNEHGGPCTFACMLDMAVNIRRTSEGSGRRAYLATIFKVLMDGPNPDYRSKLSALHRYPYSWFRHSSSYSA